MPDDGNMSLFNVNVEIPESVDNVINNIAGKPASDIGQTLSDIWYLVFGGLNLASGKKRLRIAYELDEFKNNLDKEIASVPEEKKIEPKLQIVGPALENAKYCVESEELRSMFSKLIANSMNIDFSDFIHPSFGEIIKQMSPLDAKVFEIILASITNPVIHAKRKVDEDSQVDLCNNITLIDIAPHNMVSDALENLSRLNLIDIPFGIFYSTDSLYDPIRATQAYKTLVNEPKMRFGYTIEDEKSFIDITSLGKSFAKVCM